MSVFILKFPDLVQQLIAYEQLIGTAAHFHSAQKIGDWKLYDKAFRKKMSKFHYLRWDIRDDIAW